jgi:hypothetical protein
MNPVLDATVRDKTLIVIGLLTAFSTIAGLSLILLAVWY